MLEVQAKMEKYLNFKEILGSVSLYKCQKECGRTVDPESRHLGANVGFISNQLWY